MTRLTYKTYSHAPRYRDLTLILVDPEKGTSWIYGRATSRASSLPALR
jgi:hypothetical protein